MAKKKILSKKVTPKNSKQILEMKPGGRRQIDPKKVKAHAKQMQTNKGFSKETIKMLKKQIQDVDARFTEADKAAYKKLRQVSSLVTAIHQADGNKPSWISGNPDQKYNYLASFCISFDKESKLIASDFKALSKLTVGDLIKILLPW